MSEFSYDLRTEPWIPVLGVDGRRESVGLRDVLRRAHEFLHIDSENPLFKASIIRVLIAILHRALDGPSSISELQNLRKAGRFEEKAITDYLDSYADRFDLFHEDYPFYQRAGLVVTNKQGNENTDSVKVLRHDIAVKSDKTVFDHSVDTHELAMSPSEAARALLVVQCFGLAGLARRYSNQFGYHQSYFQAPLVAGMPTIVLGNFLQETLVLNLLTTEFQRLQIPTTNEQLNVPVWERGGEDRSEKIIPHGYLDYITAQARHLRLVPQEDNGSVVVKRVHRTQGVAPQIADEPWFFYRESRSEPGTYRAPQLDPERSVWRDCDALLAAAHKEDGTTEDRRPAPLRQLPRLGVEQALVRCEIFALANEKGKPATLLYWRDIPLLFARELLDEPHVMSALRLALQLAEHTDGTLQRAAYRFGALVLGENPDKQDIRRIATSTGVSRHFWAALENPFRHLVAEIADEEAIQRWATELRRAAREAFDTCVLASAPRDAKGYRASAEASGVLFTGLKKVLAGYEAEPSVQEKEEVQS